MSWESTGLLWVPPSPNLPTPASAAAYPSTVFIEATTAAEGRGTCTPFQTFGAPFVDNFKMTDWLNQQLCPQSHSKQLQTFNPESNEKQDTLNKVSQKRGRSLGTAALNCFRASYFEPTFSKFNNTVVNATQWMQTRTPISMTTMPSTTTTTTTKMMNKKTQRQERYERPSGIVDNADFAENREGEDTNERAEGEVEDTENIIAKANANVNASPAVNTYFSIAVHMLYALRMFASPANSFQWDGSWFRHPGSILIDWYAGTPLVREMLDQGYTPDQIVSQFSEQTQQFVQFRQQFLLY
jgi:uncharacterized protein YbbC (DUF1343 family)